MGKVDFKRKAPGQYAWTSPYVMGWQDSTTTANSAHIFPVPFKHYRMRAMVVNIISTSAGTTPTFDIAGYDISASGAEASILFTAEALNAGRTYICHRDSTKCGYYDYAGTQAHWTADTSLQITFSPSGDDLFSTVTDSSLPTTPDHSGVLPYFTTTGSATNVLTVQCVVDPVSPDL